MAWVKFKRAEFQRDSLPNQTRRIEMNEEEWMKTNLCPEYRVPSRGQLDYVWAVIDLYSRESLF